MGYSYVIMQNGQVVHADAGGRSRNGADGATDMTLEDKIHIASVSKFITTVATLHLLETKNGVDEKTQVIEYLPARWMKGPGINNITFLDLIAQQSGLFLFGTQNRLACRFDSLAMYISTGSSLNKQKQYTNTHHALMRVILPRLWDKYRPNDGDYDADFTSSVYESLVQELLLEPLDINASCNSNLGNVALAYINSTDTGNGNDPGNLTSLAGGFGWYMNALELAKFWAYSWYTNDFINDDSRKIMTDNTAGLWNTTIGDEGTYYNKLGGWDIGGSLGAIAMHYPNDVDLIVLINSRMDNGLSLVSLARDTFDDSFSCN
jgi:CubicO group peptidase (beta-lactamase class C family)